MALARLNALPLVSAERALLACCGSHAWARQMADARPFSSTSQLLDSAATVWGALASADWLDAFRAHPKIGERGGPAPQPAAASRWSASEQRRVREADAHTRAALARANEEYESRFGHIFIVCATGKSASDVLATLRARLSNAPAQELRVSAGEQQKIMVLRLEKMLCDLEATGS